MPSFPSSCCLIIEVIRKIKENSININFTSLLNRKIYCTIPFPNETCSRRNMRYAHQFHFPSHHLRHDGERKCFGGGQPDQHSLFPRWRSTIKARAGREMVRVNAAPQIYDIHSCHLSITSELYGWMYWVDRFAVSTYGQWFVTSQVD